VLLVSGGHCQLLVAEGVGRYRRLGTTIDDALGEAFDKVAKMLNLGYPGGRVIDELAKSGDCKAIRFPRARLKKHPYDFSFSGIKTAVWHYLRSHGIPPSDYEKARIAASFQEAVVDMLISPTVQAAIAHGVTRVVLAGGVAANSRLRAKINQRAAAEGVEVYFPSPKFCTDNAAMIALAGYYRLKRGQRDDIQLNADADLIL
jgi:N6-L-threonylcarbamoyladenine synthase